MLDYYSTINTARNAGYTGPVMTDPNVWGVFYRLYFVNGELHNPSPLLPAVVAYDKGNNDQLCGVEFYENGKPTNASPTLPHAVFYYKGHVTACEFVDENGETHDPAPGIPAIYFFVDGEITERDHYNHGKLL